MIPLDEELAASTPPVPVLTSELDRELGLLIAEAERLAGPMRARRRRRLFLSGLMAAGVLGGGTAAAGAAGILPWFDTAPSHAVITTSGGAECRATFGVKAIDDPDEPVNAVTRAKALATAEQFLDGLDVSSIDVQAATRGLPPRASAGSESGPAESVEDYETRAVMSVVQTRVAAELGQQGLPTSAVSVSMATSCEGGDQ